MYPLVPIIETLDRLFGTSTDLPGLAPDLVVRDTLGWQPAGALAGSSLDVLLRSARSQWNARPPAAAALAWKAYTYWLSLPAIIGLLAVRRVPLLTAANVWVRLDWPHRLLQVGLRAGIPVAVLPTDRLAASGDRAIVVVQDPTALLETLRQTLIDEHLGPLMEAIGPAGRLHPRVLLGSLAANVAGVALRFADGGDGDTQAQQIEDLLAGLGLADLLELVPAGDGRLRVHRRTCCLAFTLPRPRICHDCCIRVPGS
jgi:ferric iron reductase protein FhuF